jgi:hypothetical protein
LLSSTLLCTHPTSTTLFPILSKVSVLILSFEYLTNNSIVSMKYKFSGVLLVAFSKA